MTRLRRTVTSSDSSPAPVYGLGLAFVCCLLVACGPPPSRLSGTAVVPTPAYIGIAPTSEVTPGTPVPTVTALSTTPTHLANSVEPSPTNCAGCSSGSGDTGSSTGGELHVALRENINTLNPYLVTNASELFVVSSLYDTLADEDAEGHLVPNLAEKWELSADGTRLTCWLNPQARWHTGQPVTAEDIVFSFILIRQTAFPGLAPVAALVGQAQALGPAEVQFTLLRPGSETARRVCSEVRIVPAVLWKSVQDPLTYANLDSPVGSGPFALAEPTPPAHPAKDAGQSTESAGSSTDPAQGAGSSTDPAQSAGSSTEGGFLVLRNTGVHHSTRPSVDKLIVEIIRDESQALQALKEGKFDILGWDIAPAMARDVQDHPESYPEIRLASAGGLSVHSLLFNLRQAPYDNAALRSALALAIDTQAIADRVLLGFADRATAGLFPPASLWYDSSLPSVPFDVAQAMDKLTTAGFVDRDGDGLREDPDGGALQILITCPKSDASLKAVELVVASWKAVGITAKALALPADQIRSVLMQAKFEVVLRDLSLREPEDAFFCCHSSRGLLVDGQVMGYNYGGYANADYDRIVETLLEEHNSEERLELLRRLEGILIEDLPQIPLYSPNLLQLYRDSRFSGWHPEPGVGLLDRTAIANLSPR